MLTNVLRHLLRNLNKILPPVVFIRNKSVDVFDHFYKKHLLWDRILKVSKLVKLRVTNIWVSCNKKIIIWVSRYKFK